MVDLICKRYPGKKPSDYLKIKDEYTAIQVDYAVALKQQMKDFEIEIDMQDNVLQALYDICKCLGAKPKFKRRKDRQPIMPSENITISQAISLFKSKGTKVEIIKKGQ
jgi:hypothetical protein